MTAPIPHCRLCAWCCQSKAPVPDESGKGEDELPGLHPPSSPRPPLASPVGEDDPQYDDALVACVPEKFRDWNIEKLVHNRMELQHFREYLLENYARLACYSPYSRIFHSEAATALSANE